MSLFTLVAVGANGLGPVFAGWIELNPRMEWRWIQWVQMRSVKTLRDSIQQPRESLLTVNALTLSICGAVLLLIPWMGETRSSIILTKMARKLRKKTGNKRYRARAEDERGNLKQLIWISCTRPLCTWSDGAARLISLIEIRVTDLLATEPIVASFSLWVGFAWGVLFVMVE